jgi:hypothetical protein
MLAGLMSGGIATPRSAPVICPNNIRRWAHHSAGIVRCCESGVTTQKVQGKGIELYGYQARGNSMAHRDFLNYDCV